MTDWWEEWFGHVDSAVPADRPDTGLAQLLSAGDSFALRDDVIVVFREGAAIGQYYVDGERFGPQAAFVVDFGEPAG